LRGFGDAIENVARPIDQVNLDRLGDAVETHDRIIVTAVCVTLAILADNAYVAACSLIMAGAGWGFQAPAIPTLVQHVAKDGTVGSTYGVVNGVGNLASALMPMIMGAAMMTGAVENLGHGFWLLVGTQLVTVVAGFVLLGRLGRQHASASPAPLTHSPA